MPQDRSQRWAGMRKVGVAFRKEFEKDVTALASFRKREEPLKAAVESFVSYLAQAPDRLEKEVVEKYLKKIANLLT